MQLFVLILFNIIILIIWFHSGLITGGGDTGLPFYNPLLSAAITQYAWWSGQGTGFSYPGLLSTLPLYAFLSIFQAIGFNPLTLQIFFFGGVLIFSTLGMFALAQKISGKKTIAFFIALFYLINPYSMINIWHRGSYTAMLMLIILPWTWYLLYRSFFEQRFKYLIILAVISPIFGCAFNTPAFIATWWFVIISLWVYLFFTHAIYKKLKKLYVYYLVAFIFLWLGLNFWWLFPFFHIAPTNLFITTNAADSVANVVSVSQYFTLPYALRGISTFYPIVQGDWGPIFLNPWFDALSFVELGFISVSLFYSKKIKMFGLFLFIFLFSVFVSKGSGDPFGSIITYAYAMIPYLGVFRNPFEKFGVLIPFAQCFLAGYGLYYVTKIKKRGVTAGVLLLMFGFLIYHWPFLTGHLFGSLSYPSTIQVPKEYDAVRSWFTKNDSNNPRILHLPLALGDGIVYDWPHGYWGLEPSQLFFPGSSISHFVGFPLVDSRYQDIAIAVRNRDKVLFQSLINKFAINYIVIHKDVDFSQYRTDTLNNINTFINQLSFLEKKAELGNLVIYKVKNTSQNYISIEQVANPSVVSGDFTFYPQILEESNYTQIFVDKTSDVKKENFAWQENLLPRGVLNQLNVSINKKILLQEMPFTRFLPGSFFYPLIRFKEKFEMIGKNEFDVLLLQLQDSSKRLVESDQLIGLSKTILIQQTLNEYQKELHVLSPAYTKKVQADIQGDSDLELTALVQILLRQRELLNRMNVSAPAEIKPQIADASRTLQELLYESGVESRYGTDKSPNLRIYQFSVLHSGNYRIYLSKDWLSFFANKNINTIIDGKEIEKHIQLYSDAISIGPYNLSPGYHEIGLSINSDNSFYPQIINFDKGSIDFSHESFDLKTNNKPSYLDFTIDNFHPSYTYFVSFDYWTKYGSDPEVSFVQDIDPVIKPKIDLDEITQKKYQFYWKTQSTSHSANLFAHSMKLRIILNPWNNCVDMNLSNKKLCGNNAFYQQFNRPSETIVKNIVLHKFPPNEIYLSENASRKEKTIAVSAREVNPTKYSVNLHETGNSIVVLNETYHDGWQLRDDKGRVVDAPHVLVDGYANGWVLSGLRSGNYTINFISQSDKNFGIIGGFCFLIVGSFLIFSIYKWKKHR
jgi:hypothetical protein